MNRNELEIYDWLLQSPDQVAAVHILSDDELLRVSGWLGMTYDENASTGELLGICLIERSERWAKIMNGKANGGEA